MRKYSRQREEILGEVKKSSAHPTAETIYQALKEQNPELSLGTVYRNLNLLAANGLLRKLVMPSEPDRFDGCVEPHYHMRCKQCGKVTDIWMEYLDELDERVNAVTEDRVERHTILFEGVCAACCQAAE